MTESGQQQGRGQNERNSRNGTGVQDDLLGRNSSRNPTYGFSGEEELPGRNAARVHGIQKGGPELAGHQNRMSASQNSGVLSATGWDRYRKEPGQELRGNTPQPVLAARRQQGEGGIASAKDNRGSHGGNGGNGGRNGGAAGGTGGQPPAGGPGAKKKKHHRVLLVVGIILLLVLAYGIYRYFWAPEPIAKTAVGQAVAGLFSPDDKGEAIRANRDHEANIKPFPLLAAKPDIGPIVSPSAINILVIARDMEANLFDTLLIVSMDQDTGKVRLINIPRDLYVDYSPKAVSLIKPHLSNINSDPALRKINAAHKLGKIIKYRVDSSRFGTPDYDFTADLIEEMFSLSIDDFIFVKPESFRNIVDEFGGVRVDVPYSMRYSDPTQNLKIDLQAGEQLLDGYNAEGFVRFRKGYNSKGKWFEIGDLGRKENQNLFVKAFMEQQLTLGKMGKIMDLANHYTEYMETSIVGDQKVGDYAQLGKNLIQAKFVIESVTLETKYQKINGHEQFVLGGGILNPAKTTDSGKSSGGKPGVKPTPKPAASTPPAVEVPSDGGVVVPVESPTPTPDPATASPDGSIPDGSEPTEPTPSPDGSTVAPEASGTEPTPVATPDAPPADPAATPAASTTP